MKRAKKLKKVNKDVVDGWMVTYGDMVTLLMAFFVLLYAYSDPNTGKFEAMAEGMKNAFLPEAQINEFTELHKNLQKIIEENDLIESLTVELNSRGIKIQMPGNSLFDSGKAEIKADMKSTISAIALSIMQLLDESNYKEYMIEVEGHTDDEPINSEEFNSNWDLSAIRASGIVEHLIAAGIKRDKLKVVALADSRPLLPNRDKDGSPLSKNRAKNRRVEIYINKFK